MSLQQRDDRLDTEDALVSVRGLKKYYPVKSGILKRTVGNVKAVDDVSFDIAPGETLGLVGESCCGKSTLGRTVLRLHEATEGEVLFDDIPVFEASKSEMKELRRRIQIIFQDPASSLNPRMTIEQIIDEPMRSLTDWSNKRRRNRILELVDEVGLDREHLKRAPHEFSGGQQQRVAIARALSVNPQFVVADEPTSALDVSVQADILNLMRRLQDDYDLTYLFISHDLSVVRHISDRIAVMYLGEFAEVAPTDALFETPKHPYTRALLSSIPRAEPGTMDDRILLQGDVPSPENPPSGCRFHPRCQEYIGDICETENPGLIETEADHVCACHLHDTR